MTRRSAFRWSLKTLAVVAMLVGYWYARPTILAHRFAAPMAAKDYGLAESLYPDQRDCVPGKYASERQRAGTVVKIEPVTWWQVVHRERHLCVDIPANGYEFDWQIRVVSAPQGLRICFVST